MLDIQSIYLRRSVPVKAIRAIGVLKYPAADNTPLRVFVDGIETYFIVDADESLILAVPSGLNKVAGWAITYEYATTSGARQLGGYLAEVAPTLEGAILVDVGSGDIEGITINELEAKFVATSPGFALCLLPAGVDTISSISVVTSVAALSQASAFTYALSDNIRAVSGVQKLVFQFVKLLQTTQGSDILHPSEGGNLQKLVGNTFNTDGISSIGAQVMTLINNVSAQIIVGQSKAALPPEERLLRAAIGSVLVDPNDPSKVTVDLRIENMARQSAVFNFLAGK